MADISITRKEETILTKRTIEISRIMTKLDIILRNILEIITNLLNIKPIASSKDKTETIQEKTNTKRIKMEELTTIREKSFINIKIIKDKTLEETIFTQTTIMIEILIKMTRRNVKI